MFRVTERLKACAFRRFYTLWGWYAPNLILNSTTATNRLRITQAFFYILLAARQSNATAKHILTSQRGGERIVKTLEIYFRDLTPDTQKAVLELHGIESPDEANWEFYPIFILEGPEPTDETEA